MFITPSHTWSSWSCPGENASEESCRYIYIINIHVSQNPARGGLISRNKFLHNQTQCCFQKTSLIWNNSFLAVAKVFFPPILYSETDLSSHKSGWFHFYKVCACHFFIFNTVNTAIALFLMMLLFLFLRTSKDSWQKSALTVPYLTDLVED